jgi:hypothetical protein
MGKYPSLCGVVQVKVADAEATADNCEMVNAPNAKKAIIALLLMACSPTFQDTISN